MQEQKRKRKKHNQQQTQLLDEQISDSAQELINALNELERQKIYVEIPICSKCKSPRIRRVDSTGGDMFGNMGITPPKYECSECGHITHTILKATNKPLTVKEVEHIAEANDDNSTNSP